MTGEPMQIVQGLGASAGIAIGRAVCLRTRARDVYRFPIAEDKIDAEVERLHQAVERASQELQRVRRRDFEGVKEDLSGIFEAHLLLLRDATFLGRVEGRIRDEHVNAEWAVERSTEELAQQFQKIENEYLRERGQDLLDVGGTLLRMLQGISHHELSELEDDVIIVADDLPPAEAVRLGREQVVGFALEGGGRTSHTAIIARSLQVPAVTGLEKVTLAVTDEDPVIVDGSEGKVILHPTAEALEDYRGRQRRLEAEKEQSLATRDLPATTADGTAVALMANIDLPEEIDEAVSFGAAGVGLYRSEFLYIERSPELPTEEEHIALYRRLAEAMAPHPVIIRTYDLGGRKLAREMMDTREANPVLGLRGIRLTMARPEIFRTQLRALYRAGVHGEISMMLPLVSTLEEIRRFKEFAREIQAELAAEGLEYRRDLPLGVMIEVPSAALISDLLAPEVDFFSIGTNDLIQYSLAVDRNNDQVAGLYQPLHPGLLRMLGSIVGNARAHGIQVGICGEMASDPRLAPILLGLGLRRLSMSPRQVPAVKAAVRSVSIEEVESLTTECLGLSTAAEIETRVDRFLSGRTL